MRRTPHLSRSRRLPSWLSADSGLVRWRTPSRERCGCIHQQSGTRGCPAGISRADHRCRSACLSEPMVRYFNEIQFEPGGGGMEFWTQGVPRRRGPGNTVRWQEVLHKRITARHDELPQGEQTKRAEDGLELSSSAYFYIGRCDPSFSEHVVIFDRPTHPDTSVAPSTQEDFGTTTSSQVLRRRMARRLTTSGDTASLQTINAARSSQRGARAPFQTAGHTYSVPCLQPPFTRSG